MRLKLTAGLRYPITVTELLKQPSSQVKQNEPIFKFSYTTYVEEDDIDGDGETKKVEVLYHSRFESESEGTFTKWLVRERQIINQPIDVAEIEEACAHEFQFAGQCLNCGKDTTWIEYNTTRKQSDRANVNMVHDNAMLKVSANVALQVENESKRRLVNAKKLSLVVDLDMTIIHATVDPTVAEWQQDPTNPNYESVKDVQSFKLKDGPPATTETSYYIKMRPGLQQFLDGISKIYELHIYTMGTRAYAQAVAKIVDPEKRFFGDRILSRDESGSMTVKSLQRLFPVDQKMVVIIDDRSDVWRWSKNLLRVSPFDFFTGSGDINASFLPPKPKTQSTPTSDTNGSSAKGKAKVNGTNGAANETANGEESALEQFMEMGGSENEKELKEKTEKAAQAVEDQVKLRPLAQAQVALDQKEESDSQSGSESDESPDRNIRHSLLHTTDTELTYIEDGLRKVHEHFYDEYKQNMATIPGGRLDKMHESKKADASDTLDLELLPDVKDVMSSLKQEVLGDVSAVFSGVVPLDTPVKESDLVVWAMTFGLTVRENLRKSTTHLVAAKTGTAKVKLALRQGRGKIKVVNTQWLMDSILRWKKQDETNYMLHSEDDYIEPLDERTGVEEIEEDVLSDSGEPVDDTLTDGDTTDTERTRPAQGKSRIKSKKRFYETELEPDTDDEYAPESPFDDKKPIGGDEVAWEGMEDDLAEFLDDGSDEESVASDLTSQQSDGSRTPLVLSQGNNNNSNKRRLEEIGDDSADDGPRKRSRDEASDKDDADDDDAEEDWDAIWEEEEEEERKRQSADNSPEVKDGAAFSATKGEATTPPPTPPAPAS